MKKYVIDDSINNNITDNINDIITRKIKSEESLWIKQM